MAVILRYFSEFGYLPGALRKSSRSLSHLLMSSCYFLLFTVQTVQDSCRLSPLHILPGDETRAVWTRHNAIQICRFNCYRPSLCRLSSVTLVRPTQVIQIFSNISTALGSTAGALRKSSRSLCHLLMSTWFNDLTLSLCVASRRWAGCEYNHMYVKCPTSSTCIHLTHFCDGVNDCGDNSDEPPTCGLLTVPLSVLLIHRVTVT